MTKQNKNYPQRESKDLKQTIRELKSANRRLKKDKEQLIRELQTLKDGFNESVKYINEELENIPIQDIVKYFARKRRAEGKLREVKQAVSKPRQNKVEQAEAREATLKKFQQWIKRKTKEQREDQS